MVPLYRGHLRVHRSSDETTLCGKDGQPIRPPPLAPWLDTWRQFKIKRRIEASTSASSAQQERFEIGRSANEAQTTKQSRLRKQLSVNDFVQVVRSLTAQRSQEHPSPKLPKLLSKPE